LPREVIPDTGITGKTARLLEGILDCKMLFEGHFPIHNYFSSENRARLMQQAMIHAMPGHHNGVFPIPQFQTCTLTPPAAR